MKTKTIRFIKEKRTNLLKEIKKDKNNYKFVIENISRMRDETRLFKSIINKKPSELKDLYFKYFGHLH
jgi:predicted nuclease with TOPRIM domain